MTTVDSKPIPRYFVREETTAGPLYFWPLPAVRQSYSDGMTERNRTWFDDDGNQAEERDGYVVTQQQTSTLTAMWPEHPKLSHFEVKPEADLSPIARTLIDADPAAYPTTIGRDDWESRCEYGADSDCYDCTWHKVREGIYRKVMTSPSTGQHTFDVSGLELLDIYEPDPDPDRSWRLTSPSLAAFYPRPAHHQFPGELGGVFEMLEQAVRSAAGELSIPVTVNAYTHSREINVTANILWDAELAWTPAHGRSRKARELTASRRKAARQAMHWYETIKVPPFVTGETKADALRKLTEWVESMVTRLLPPHTVACEKCKGLGYIR